MNEPDPSLSPAPSPARDASRTPTVSIGMPVYNGANFLAEAIEAVLAQDFTDFELIISDNASTDATAEICARYSASDPRVRYYRNAENIGAAGNYNRVFALSRGTYFKWAAHDDTLDPRFVGRCVEGFRTAGEDVSIVFCDALYVDDAGEAMAPGRDHMKVSSRFAAVRAFEAMQRMNLPVPVFGLIRRDLAARTGLIGSFIAADYVFLLQAAMLGRFVRIEEPLLKWRLHAASSQRANASEASFLQWFDPRAKTRRLSTWQRLFVEYLRSAFVVKGLGPLQRLACLLGLTTGFLVKRSRVILGRWRRRLFKSA